MRLIALFVFAAITECAFGQIGAIEVDILQHRVKKWDSYATGSGSFSPRGKGNGFVEVIMRISNTSNSKIQYDLNQILLEGNGMATKPALIMHNMIINSFLKSNIKLKANDSKERKLVYVFPENITPAGLILEGYYKIPFNENDREERIYYDEENRKISSPDGAFYYSIASSSEGELTRKDFYVSNDKLRMNSQLSTFYPEVKDGPTTWYYENGRIKEQGNYEDNVRVGLFFTYHQSGGKRSEIDYSSQSVKYIQYWDEEGNELLISGNGTVETVNDRGNLSISQYEDYYPVKGMEIRTMEGDTIYSYIDKVPEYQGGMKAFYSFIAKNLKYPNEARRSGIEGVVFVQFLVNKLGELTEVKVVKGIGGGCDAESLRVIQMSKRWITGEDDGQPVKTRMILPITFKLG